MDDRIKSFDALRFFYLFTFDAVQCSLRISRRIRDAFNEIKYTLSPLSHTVFDSMDRWSPYQIHLGPIFRVKRRKCTFNIQTTGINGLITVDCMRVDFFHLLHTRVRGTCATTIPPSMRCN